MMLPTTTLDQWMERILFVTRPEPITPENKPKVHGPQGELVRDVASSKGPRGFGFALFVSATRCILQYVVVPFILPVLGFVGDTPAWFSLSLSALAFLSLFTSLRRFWQSHHPRRFAYLPLAILMTLTLILFVLSDLRRLHV
jgi:hypothetical protein